MPKNKGKEEQLLVDKLPPAEELEELKEKYNVLLKEDEKSEIQHKQCVSLVNYLSNIIASRNNTIEELKNEVEHLKHIAFNNKEEKNMIQTEAHRLAEEMTAVINSNVRLQSRLQYIQRNLVSEKQKVESHLIDIKALEDKVKELIVENENLEEEVYTSAAQREEVKKILQEERKRNYISLKHKDQQLIEYSDALEKLGSESNSEFKKPEKDYILENVKLSKKLDNMKKEYENLNKSKEKLARKLEKTEMKLFISEKRNESGDSKSECVLF